MAREGKRGKFIALEGTDGSGKTEQFERLILALPEWVKFATLDFPRYSEPSSCFVQRYLTGYYGGEVGPYEASIFFALDRFDAKLKALEWLDEGKVIIANRYVASNMGHQGAKIESPAEREKFFKWLYELEYGILGIPKPDLNIVLHVPAEIAAELVSKKRSRAYLQGKKRDIHEIDFAHQKRAEEVYLEIVKLYPRDFVVIECAEGKDILPPEAIHEKVMAVAKPILGI